MSNGTSTKPQHLESLAGHLDAFGLTITRHFGASPARLLVENGELCADGEAVMSECITVKAQDSTMFFCWRAGDPIGTVDDLQEVAVKIASVLTLHEPGRSRATQSTQA